MITPTQNCCISEQSKSTQPSHLQLYIVRLEFERAGLVQKVDVGDGKSHYEIARDQHEHLVDTENGQIHEFKSEELTHCYRK